MISVRLLKYMKHIEKIVLIAVIGIAAWWLWKITFTTNVSYDNLTRITNVKEMIRLNTLDIVDEIVCVDTFNSVGVVYNIRAKVVIGFNLDSLKYEENNGVLEIELPQNYTISIHSLDCKLLDYYNVGFTGDLFGDPDISSQEWAEIRAGLKKSIEKEIIKKGYVQRARANALDNLAKLCHALKGNVKVIDRQNGPKGISDIEQGKITFINDIENP